MLNLTSKLTLDADTIQAANLTDKFTDEDLTTLGNWVFTGYTIDKASRAKWEKRTEAAMDLAMQIQKEKNFPWPGCSNIQFPLATIAVMQFHARAYPAIITGPEVVKYRVTGSDPKGREHERAERVGMHMSWQLMEQNSNWEPQHDSLLINYAVVGSAYKKSYPGKNKSLCSDLVMAKDLVMDYYAKCVEECPRKTHVIPLFRNEIYERVHTGQFRNILDENWYKQPAPPPVATQQNANADNRAGTVPPPSDETTPFTFLEQHCDLDLDQDGYAEPYIITIEQRSTTVVRIVCRFEQEADIDRNKEGAILRIRATEYFTGYIFLPSPDGGVYGMGFGVLIGPLNESANSLINQLVDAGSMSNAAGGFLGRGAKIRGGIYTFAPFGWQRVDSTGDDLRKSVFPLPVREPSNILFQLLSFIVNYTNRISGSTDIMVGESVGQNTPADTARQMQAEGMKIYNAIFKRCWTSMKAEFKKCYIINARYMPDSMTFGLDGQLIGRADYLGDPTRISPVADPTATSQEERIQKALLLKQTAMTTPGYNVVEVEKIWLKAQDIPNIDLIYNPEQFPPGKDIKLQMKEMDVQLGMAKLEAEQQQFIAEQQSFAMDLMEQRRLNDAKITQLMAQAESLLVGIQTEMSAQQAEQYRSMAEMLKSHNDLLSTKISHATELIKLEKERVSHRISQQKLEKEEAVTQAKKKELANVGSNAK